MSSTLPWPANPANLRAGKHSRKNAQSSRRKTTIAIAKPDLEVPSLVKSTLGPLECEVLTEVCSAGECSAREVLERLQRPLAYTTVSTTLARLYRKGLLNCRLSGNSFLYTARLTSAQVELQLARDLLQALVQCAEVDDDELVALMLEVFRAARPNLFREMQRAGRRGQAE